MGPIGEDKRWEAFGPFQDYLVRSFPLTCAPFLFNDSERGVNMSFSLATKALN